MRLGRQQTLIIAKEMTRRREGIIAWESITSRRPQSTDSDVICLTLRDLLRVMKHVRDTVALN